MQARWHFTHVEVVGQTSILKATLQRSGCDAINAHTESQAVEFRRGGHTLEIAIAYNRAQPFSGHHHACQAVQTFADIQNRNGQIVGLVCIIDVLLGLQFVINEVQIAHLHLIAMLFEIDCVRSLFEVFVSGSVSEGIGIFSRVAYHDMQGMETIAEGRHVELEGRVHIAHRSCQRQLFVEPVLHRVAAQCGRVGCARLFLCVHHPE